MAEGRPVEGKLSARINFDIRENFPNPVIVPRLPPIEGGRVPESAGTSGPTDIYNEIEVSPLAAIIKVAPTYPDAAISQGLESGYVILEYTVNPSGRVENISAVESSSGVYEDAAISSASRWKYKPRYENGQPVAVEGVRSRIDFTLP
jgi:protein TonB